MSNGAKVSVAFLKGLLFLIRNNLFIILFFILLILGDVLLFDKSSDWRIFPILFLYIVFIFRFHVRANATFILCLALFILIYIQFAFSPPSVFESQYPFLPAGEKIAVWLYLFLIIGVVQKFRE